MSILKKISPFLNHAKTLENADPIMSYFCRYYAVQEGIKLKPDPETKKILFSEMDKLELVTFLISKFFFSFLKFFFNY